MSSPYCLKSMTAFAHAAGYSAPYHWVWEMKSVNAKGLDARLRLAHGFDDMESELRARLARHVTRGTIYITLTVTRDAQQPEIKINQQALLHVVQAVEALPRTQAIGPATLDGLLSIKGIVDVHEQSLDEKIVAQARAAILAGFDEALAACVRMRQNEGQALTRVLASKVERIAALTQEAEHHPARQVEAIRARLQQSIDLLLNANIALDPARLHQEAVILAAKADVREELDRLKTHVAAVQQVMQSPHAVGRKLDFLAQELAREANTFCAKSNDAALSALGMDLRIEIEQFREQVQNIE